MRGGQCASRIASRLKGFQSNLWFQKMNEITKPKALAEVACPVCCNSEANALFTVKDWALLCSESVFVVKKCTSCGCGYLSPRPVEEEIFKYYPTEFYWSWEGVDKSITWAEIVTRRKGQIKAKAEWLDDLAPGRLLDVGAQKGEFIWYMKVHGWDVEGVEMDSSVPNPAKMPIRYGDFRTMNYESERYDAITFWAVLEHVYSPVEFVEKAVRLLKPGGRLTVLVTNLDSIQSRVLCQDDYPRHLTIFTKSALQALFEKNGMRVLRSSTDQKIFGGALNGGLVYVCKRLFGYSRDEAFREWKQVGDPNLFWTMWRGHHSEVIRWISRIDRLMTKPLEMILDRFGYGFILTVSAEKSHDNG